MFHWKILGCAHDDRLWLWRFTLSPKHKRWSDLELLWDHRLQGEHRGDICRIVGFHRHSFHLGAGAFANVEGGRDLTFLSRRHFLRSEEHTSELQSQSNIVCRLLLEKQDIGPQPPQHVRYVRVNESRRRDEQP